MSDDSKNLQIKTYRLNYIYFAIIFLFLSGLHIYHVFLVDKSAGFSFWFYSLYALLESLIEVTIFAWILSWAQKQFSSPVPFFLVQFCFAVFLCQLIDFPLERLMDMSIWQAIEFVSQESYANFIEMLYATNISLITWFLGLLGIVGVGCGNIFLFRITEQICNRKPILTPCKTLFGFLTVLLFCLFLWDTAFFSFSKTSLCARYEKALPWKTILFPPEDSILLVNGFLKDRWNEKDGFMGLDSRPFSLERKPDIYLFVVESVREDYLSKDVAPYLVGFREENLHFSKALSNANATQISWFSLFYSMLPFYWTNYQINQWKQGSIPLTLFKKMGYEINVYASSRLSYYNMDEVLFGKNHYLADRFYEVQADHTLPAWESDQIAMDLLYRDATTASKKGGRLFITFLDSTHFDYSWPDEHPILFEPIEDKIDFVNVVCERENLLVIQNRYKNALHYIDTLFGKFQNRLKEAGRWEESVVVFTADHGEEFNEHGHMFHATDLTKPQIHIPLYCKLSSDMRHPPLVSDTPLSHIDLFPSLCHYISGEDSFDELFQGISFFRSEKRNYVIGGRYNASRSPYEFYIHNGTYKLIAQFCDKSDIFHCRSLRVLAVKNEQEENIPFTLSQIRHQFGDALDSLFAPQ